MKGGRQFARDLAGYWKGFTLYPKCLEGMSADRSSMIGFVSKPVVQAARGRVDQKEQDCKDTEELITDVLGGSGDQLSQGDHLADGS